jgi:hypothetical protein
VTTNVHYGNSRTEQAVIAPSGNSSTSKIAAKTHKTSEEFHFRARYRLRFIWLHWNRYFSFLLQDPGRISLHRRHDGNTRTVIFNLIIYALRSRGNRTRGTTSRVCRSRKKSEDLQSFTDRLLTG